MIKTGRKRKVSGGKEVEIVQSRRKKFPVENQVVKSLISNHEQVVSEFVKMANVKQTRLKGEWMYYYYMWLLHWLLTQSALLSSLTFAT